MELLGPTLAHTIALCRTLFCPLEDNGHVTKQDKASTLHAHEDRLSYVRNKEQGTNKDASQDLTWCVCACIIYAQRPMPLSVARIQHLNNDTGPQQTSLRTNSQYNTEAPRKQAMPSFRPNEKDKISKANRPRTRLCDRRLARMHDAKGPSKFVLRTKKRSLSERNPELALKISQMRLTIAPIVHVVTGFSAPDYPCTMLKLFTLTEAQLDRLAEYYSQTHTPTELTHKYPTTMDWSKPALQTDPTLPEDCKSTDIERLKIKMRMFARFIGMRGADTPLWEHERAIQILGNRIGHAVRQEKEESLQSKGYRGLPRY